MTDGPLRSEINRRAILVRHFPLRSCGQSLCPADPPFLHHDPEENLDILTFITLVFRRSATPLQINCGSETILSLRKLASWDNEGPSWNE